MSEPRENPEAEKQQLIERALEVAKTLSPETLVFGTDSQTGIKEVLKLRLEQALFGGKDYYDTPLSYEEAGRITTDWMDANGVYYYARPRESFSESEAMRLAQEARNQYIVLYDLS